MPSACASEATFDGLSVIFQTLPEVSQLLLPSNHVDHKQSERMDRLDPNIYPTVKHGWAEFQWEWISLGAESFRDFAPPSQIMPNA